MNPVVQVQKRKRGSVLMTNLSKLLLLSNRWSTINYKSTDDCVNCPIYEDCELAGRLIGVY